MSTSDHPETDGLTERANRVLEEILRGYVHSFSSWSEFLPMVEFAINNSVHASTQHTPFFVNGFRHPRLLTFSECDSRLRGGLIRPNTNRALTRYVLTTWSPLLTPMSLTSTSVKKREVRERMLLLTTILIESASRLVRLKTHSQRQQVILMQYTPRSI